MTRLFRQPRARAASWLALAAFALAYLSALALVLAPGLTQQLAGGLP